MKCVWLAMVVVAAAGCGSEEAGGSGGGGGTGGGAGTPSSSSSSSSASTGSTSASSGTAPQGAGGGGADPGVGGGGHDPGVGGYDESGVGGGGLTCADCSETEQCEECISDDEDEDPSYECWPAEAPEGEFLCGSTTCIADTQYCYEERSLISTCASYVCLGMDLECDSDDPCECAGDCGSLELISCSVDADGQVHLVCYD